MQDTTSPPEATRKLAKLIHGIKIAMMTTADTDGTLRSRPMATQAKEFDGDLWFLTGKSSHKVAELDADHRVNLSYADPSASKYVSVSGTGRLVQDRAKAEELWNPAYKAWFPGGLDDPELCLLRVTPTQAEYWDTPGGVVVHVIGFVKAIATGKRAEPGEHEKLNLAT
jgi:general stress protein 26